MPSFWKFSVQCNSLEFHFCFFQSICLPFHCFGCGLVCSDIHLLSAASIVLAVAHTNKINIHMKGQDWGDAVFQRYRINTLKYTGILTLTRNLKTIFQSIYHFTCPLAIYHPFLPFSLQILVLSLFFSILALYILMSRYVFISFRIYLGFLICISIVVMVLSIFYALTLHLFINSSEMPASFLYYPMHVYLIQ